MVRRLYGVSPPRRRSASRWVVGCHPLEDHIGESEHVFDLVVQGPGPEWVDTGLVDPYGDPIMRRVEEPIGFLAGMFE